MAKKLSLKLKKKEPAAAGAAPAAPMFAAPSGGAGGIVLELRGADINIKEVVIKPAGAQKAAKKKGKKK